MPPDDPNCIIVFFGIIRNHILYFMFTPGDIEWTKHDLLLPIAEDVGVADTLECVGAYDGEVYMYTFFGKFF